MARSTQAPCHQVTPCRHAYDAPLRLLQAGASSFGRQRISAGTDSMLAGPSGIVRLMAKATPKAYG